MKFVFDALTQLSVLDQATRVCDPPAWSLTQNRVFNPLDLFKV